MRPQRDDRGPRQRNLGELVCSNSLRSDSLTAPAGLLKAEMRRLDSLVIRCAEANRVPAGSALAVDREQFQRALTRAIEQLATVRIVREEIRQIPGRWHRHSCYWAADFAGACRRNWRRAWARSIFIFMTRSRRLLPRSRSI